MARVDAMLRMLVQQGGDTLELRRGKAPVFLADGRPLRLFFPDLVGGLYDQITDGLLSDDHKAGLGGGTLRFDYAPAGIGRFTVTVDAPQGDHIVVARDADAPEVAVAVAPPVRPAAAAAVEPVRVEAPPVRPRRPRERTPDPDVAADGAGMSAILRGWLVDAAARGASDLHLLDGEAPMVRVDGRLSALPSASAVDVEAALGGLLDDADRATLAGGGSIDRALTADDGARLRLHVYRCEAGLAAALRVLRRVAPDLGSLGFLVDLDPLVSVPAGLVLVCGPSGAGKSTTLAALARRALQLGRGLLVTLEDPIEYTFGAELAPLVRQRQVGVHTPDFAAGLRDALREDPDILLVGELRDTETITLALTAAETGHLVLGSLHAPSTTSAVERIVDAYAPERQRQVRVQLADVLRAFVGQRLVPRASGHGRVPAVEVLRNTRAVAALLRDGRTPQLVSALQTGRDEGLVQLERNLRDLVTAGLVDEDDALAAAHDPATFQQLR